MRKKIAYFGIKGLPSKAGADRVVEAIVSGVDKDLYEPTVYCSGRLVPKNAVYPGVRLVRIPVLPGKHLHATVLFILAALHAIFLGDYDLIHLHNVESSFMLPLLRLRYKVVSTSHAVPQDRDKWGKFAKLCLRLTEYPFILFSNALTGVAGPLTEYYKTHYNKQVQYIPNGVDEDIRLDTAAAKEFLAQHDLEPGKYILFAAGRIIRTKGCHFLLEAFRDIDTDVNLLVLGDETQIPSYAEELHQMADARVRFGGFVSSKAMLMGLVAQARLFVFPSTIEAMSMMLLEAASVGTPTVGSDIPENTAILPEQILYFKSADVSDLREKLQWALAHPDEMRELSFKAKSWVNQNYRWREIVKEYERLYEQLFSESRAALPEVQSL